MAQPKPANIYVENAFYKVWDATWAKQWSDVAKRNRPLLSVDVDVDTEADDPRSRRVVVPILRPDMPGQRAREDVDTKMINRSDRWEDDEWVSKTDKSNHTAFLVHNLLSNAECLGLISVAQPLMESTDTQYAQRNRRSDRALLYAPALAKELYDRVLPSLRPEDYANRIPMCFGHDGVWRPHCINPVMKVVKYEAGGLFSDHRDGPWIPREDQASLFTVVVYLNEKLVGGATTLIGVSPTGQDDNRSRYVTGGISVKPTVGMGLIFNHDMLHSGDPVRTGTKYILRAEIVFERASTGVASMMQRYAYLVKEAYIETAKLYRESTDAGQAGDKTTFMSKYQDVVVRQRKAAEDSLSDMLGSVTDSSSLLPNVNQRMPTKRPTRRLTDAEFSAVLLFLTDVEVVSLMATCRKAYFAVATSSMWRERCLLRFGNDLPRVLRAAASSAVAEHLPWVSIYQQQRRLSQSFVPCVMWPTSTGIRFASLADTPPNTRNTCNPTRRMYGISTKLPLNDIPSSLSGVKWIQRQFPDVFGGLQYSYPLHMNFPMSERHTVGFSLDPGSRVDHPRPIHLGSGRMEWSVLVACVDYCIDSTMVPLLLVDFPTLKRAERAAWRKAAARDLFEIFRFPALQCVGVRQAAAVRWAVERGVSVDELPPFDLVVRMNDVFSVFLHSNADDDCTVASNLADFAAYKPAATTLCVDLAHRSFDASAPKDVASPAWMAEWASRFLPADSATRSSFSVEARSWSWVLEGAQCVGMRPEFRSECVFRNGSSPSDSTKVTGVASHSDSSFSETDLYDA